MNLLLSIAALLAGPALFAVGRRNVISRGALDWIIRLTIVYLVGWHIVPDALAVAGFAALLTAVVGLVFPLLLEALFRHAHDTAHRLIVALAAVGLFVHAALDGVALASSATLAWAIALHRIPVGIAIWWTVRPAFGYGVAVVTLALIVVASTAGYLLADAFAASAESVPLALLQSFVAGSLVHVAVFGMTHGRHDA